MVPRSRAGPKAEERGPHCQISVSARTCRSRVQRAAGDGSLGVGSGDKHCDPACSRPGAGARRLRRAARGRSDRPTGHDRSFQAGHSRLHGRARTAPCARRRHRNLDLRRRLHHDRQSALDGRPQLQPLGEAGALRCTGRHDQRPREPGRPISCPTDEPCRPAGNARSRFRPAPGGANCFKRRTGGGSACPAPSGFSI